MKNIITKVLALGVIMLLGLSACKKDGTLVTVNSSSTVPGTLAASATTVALSKANLTANAIAFTGTAATYGYSASVTYSLQFDVHSDNFATPLKEVILSNGVYTQSYNVQDFNNILLAMGLKTGVATQVDVRLKSSLSSTAGIAYSNVVTLNVTPFALVSYVYVPGAYQGWNPATADSLQSATGNGIYIGIINFTGTDQTFKITPAKNWSASYGSAGAGLASLSAGSNLQAPAAGQTIVTLNTNTGTITYAAANYYSLIGSAPPGTAWSTDSDMKFMNDATQSWVVTVPMSVGQFKIRQNHDWTYSWGDISPADGTDATDASGGNINIATAKTYTVSFKIPITAVGTTPSVTATYTVK